MKSLQKYLTLVILSLFFLSCENEKPLEPTKPDNLLSQAQMVKVLTEMHLANSMVAAKSTTMDSALQKETNYYAAIYKKHGVSEKDFKSSFDYYTLKPVEIDSIYSRVIINLSEKENEFRGVKKEVVDTVLVR